MQFCFYPRHEYACPHVGHCPHLGGAALGSVVDAASDQGDYLDMLHGQLDAARRSVSQLLAEIETLRGTINGTGCVGESRRKVANERVVQGKT